MRFRFTDPKHFALTSAILISLVAVIVSLFLMTFLNKSIILLLAIVGITVFPIYLFLSEKSHRIFYIRQNKDYL